ncbi:ADP-ribosylglycohydrolase family protein [Nocardia sp. NPDC057353]|uniref:ADP-ribosylglycohydrolase family protein n=1 Tax=Nocardia sp. NPDC057353 TaxID=3346104 RepID=UPI003630BD5E
MTDLAILRDRVRGSLLGGAAGDALGAPIEFWDLRTIRGRLGAAGASGFLTSGAGPQEVTDDTQMTLFTAEGLLRWRPGTDPARPLRRAYLRWLETQRRAEPGPEVDSWLAEQRFLYAVRAPGNACLSGLDRQQRELVPPHRVGRPGPVNTDSKGCGTVMRSAPFGLVGFGAEMAFAVAAVGAQLTHGHPTGCFAAGAMAALLDRVLGGAGFEEALDDTLAQLSGQVGAQETVEALRRAIECADAGAASAERVEEVGAGWVAEECLAIAVYCALHAARTGDVRGALLLSVNHSGDSDSTGSVAGNLLGAVHGLGALPAEWVEAVEGYDTIVRVADDLVANFFLRDRGALGDRYPFED